MITMSTLFACFLVFLPCFVLGDDIHLGTQKGPGVIQGDIILPRKINNRNGILRSKRWTNGLIPYTINMTGYEQEHADMITEAMRTIEKHTCIRFKERTNEPNYVVIMNGGLCCSSVGMEGGQQWISLNKWGCFSHHTVIHELLHAVGLWHEQMRYDRDRYVTIIKDNLADQNAFYNFAMASEETTSIYDIPYNYASVMHYDAWAFSNGSVTIQPHDDYMIGVMGLSKTANETDFEKVRRIYECKGKYPIVPPDNDPCTDKWPDCDIQSDRCKSDRYTVENCRKTCGYCQWGAKVTATPRPCKDFRSDCESEHWVQEKMCEKDKEWRERTCPYTCGFCGVRTTTARPPKTDAPARPDQGKCVDAVDYCYQYAHQCKTEETVKYHCPKTCGLC